MHLKQFPFAVLHQLTGQKEGISAADFRVFRQYKRNHAVFIILDDAADYCEPPQQLKDSTAEQDPGRSGDTAQFIQKKDLGDGSLSVAVCFQKITSFTHKEHIADKKMIQKGDNDSQNQEKSGNVPAFGQKIIDGAEQGEKGRCARGSEIYEDVSEKGSGGSHKIRDKCAVEKTADNLCDHFGICIFRGKRSAYPALDGWNQSLRTEKGCGRRVCAGKHGGEKADGDHSPVILFHGYAGFLFHYFSFPHDVCLPKIP